MPRLSSRAKRRLIARALEPSRASEARYVRALRSLAKDVHEQTLSFLLARTDATIPVGFEEELTRIIVGVQVQVAALFDRHAAAISRTNKRGLRVVGIKASDLGIPEAIALRRAENVDLVVKAGRAYAQSVKDIFDAPENFGLRVEELQAKLQERGGVSESRAELIARDQTLKLNGAITETRQTNAGVQEYTWSTSLDERVRESHAALEGQRFAWSSPPSVGHPGQDFQCRCVGIPVISELEGL